MSFSGRDSSPAVSPDGHTVAFTSDRDGQPRIWLKQVSGEGEAPLTSGPDDSPAVLAGRDADPLRPARRGGHLALPRGGARGRGAPAARGRDRGGLVARREADRLPAPAERGRPDGDVSSGWRRRTAPSRARSRRCRAGCARPAWRPTGARSRSCRRRGRSSPARSRAPCSWASRTARCAPRPRPTRAATSPPRRGPPRARSSTCRPSRWSARRGARRSSCGRTRRAAASSRRPGARRARSSSTCWATGASCSTRGRRARTCAR